jgi:hypothetical protein
MVKRFEDQRGRHVFRLYDGENRSEKVTTWLDFDQLIRATGAKCSAHFPQSQLFPQLHSLLSFMGQFLPVLLQFGLSAAKDTVQTAATRIENRIFM